MSDLADREADIYGDALALPASERAAFLDRECGGDLNLRRRVEDLLSVCDEAGTFFEGLEVVAEPARFTRAEAPGKWIDRYLLLEQIGEGGCGVVYRAEQEKPVQRQVALKIIKLGMDTKQVVARFDAERQALAMMDHPHIARVLDAGATETGRPYFVMELVRGTKITTYCDQHQLTIPQRLDLFIQACRAIQHAHQKGVIHRDIKPSNILVTVQDGHAFPKVIDFGIAKATQGRRLTKKTVFTAVEQFLGTPAYMSPEQAEQGGIDIDTRSDIYSLGVLLYELLTSKTPFDTKALLDDGIDALRRTIREEEPQRPSVSTSSLAAAELGEVAANRRVEPGKLLAAIRDDLDWIVMKALEKERSRRYETVNSLIRDIERHLASEPIRARPPSRLNRFRKIVHRNKLTFTAAAAVLLALVLGFGVSTWLFLLEKDARRLALAAKEEQERLRQKAETEALNAKQFARSLEDVLDRLGPAVSSTQGRATLSQILDELPAAVGTRPEVSALLRMRAFLRGNSGRFDASGEDLARLIEQTPNDSELWHWRAATFVHAGDYEGYRRHCQQAIERFKNTTDYFTGERIAKDALVLPDSGVDMDAVDVMIETALRAGDAHSEIGWFQLAKGMSEYRKGRYERAVTWLRLVKQRRDAYLDAEVCLMLAMSYHQLGKEKDAQDHWKQANEVFRAYLPKAMTGEVQGGWVDWIYAHTLAHEAKALLATPPISVQPVAPKE